MQLARSRSLLLFFLFFFFKKKKDQERSCLEIQIISLLLFTFRAHVIHGILDH